MLLEVTDTNGTSTIYGAHAGQDVGNGWAEGTRAKSGIHRCAAWTGRLIERTEDRLRDWFALHTRYWPGEGFAPEAHIAADIDV